MKPNSKATEREREREDERERVSERERQMGKRQKNGEHKGRKNEQVHGSVDRVKGENKQYVILEGRTQRLKMTAQENHKSETNET